MKGLPMALRLAAREMRSGVGGFGIFLFCIALGVAAISGIGGVARSVDAGLKAEGRNILGGDIDMRMLHNPAGPEHLRWLGERTNGLSRVLEMRAMAGLVDGDSRALVELKAVDAAYPLVGGLGLDPPMELADALAYGNGSFGGVADIGLLRRLGLEVGGKVRIGEALIELRAALLHEPDRVADALSLGPRLLVSMDAVEASGLIQPGSQIRHHVRALLPQGTDAAAVARDFEGEFPDTGWRIRGPDDAAPGVERFVERLGMFLTFVGLTVLLVGGVGVANAVSAYLDGRMATIAAFKCLGAPEGLIFGVYLVQVLGLALLGIAIGLLAGLALPFAAAALLAEYLPAAPRGGIYPFPMFVAAVFGLLTAVTFAIWPLARAGRVPATALFRGAVGRSGGAPGPAGRVAVGVGGLGLAALTLINAAEPAFAFWFVIGAAATLGLLRVGVALLALLARNIRGRTAVWRLALASLHRPGAASRQVVPSLGVGMAVLVAVVGIEDNLGRQISERLPEEAPAFFFIDIQDHQARDFDALIASLPEAGGYRRVPSLRGRITAIDGVPVGEREIDPQVSWAVRGDRALTYSALAPEGAEITAGRWWPADYAGPPLISMDAAVAKGFGVGVGDSLTLGVLGREITAEIASLRRIDWRSLRFDFAIIFAPGTLEGAPHGHISALAVGPAAEEKVERAVAAAFPNVTAIRVRDALTAAASMLAGIGASVRGAALVTVLAGAAVLAGAVAAGRRRRNYEAVVFKVLGATRIQVLKAFLLEYGMMGLATALVGASVGSLAAWAVVSFIMGMAWSFSPMPVLAVALGCLALTLVAGFAGTWHAMGRKATPYLRND